MSTSGGDTPGIYHVADHSRVSQSEAMRVWVPIALDELIATARKYDGLVTYKELALRVQDVSGIRTRVLITNWIGKLLEEVASLAKNRGEPPLTALCVHQDGTMGEGYRRAPKSVPDSPGDDIDLVAAEHRLLCYRKYAEDLPADGGQANLTPAELARRSRPAQVVATPPPTCPNCFMQLPGTGVCDQCGWSPDAD